MSRAPVSIRQSSLGRGVREKPKNCQYSAGGRAAVGGMRLSDHWRNMFLAMKTTLAGRSARRRMKYGYHSVPNGMYTLMP